MLNFSESYQIHSFPSSVSVMGGPDLQAEPQIKRLRSASVILQSSSLYGVTSVISIDDLTSECIGRGRSGSVYKIKLEKQDLACKLYDTYKAGNDERMKRELRIYERLMSSQGRFIPRIHSVVMMDGDAVGICMTLLKPLPFKLSHWTKDEKYQAKGVLIKLADEGVFHDDIKTDNFGMTSDKRMMVFDFEDATCRDELPLDIEVHKFTERYKKRICRMFKENK